jgi:hypothetical protein
VTTGCRREPGGTAGYRPPSPRLQPTLQALTWTKTADQILTKLSVQLLQTRDTRDVAWEALLLVGAPEVVEAAWTWVSAAARLESFARNQVRDPDRWSILLAAQREARAKVYAAPRRDLGLRPGFSGASRRPRSPPSSPADSMETGGGVASVHLLQHQLTHPRTILKQPWRQGEARRAHSPSRGSCRLYSRNEDSTRQKCWQGKFMVLDPAIPGGVNEPAPGESYGRSERDTDGRTARCNAVRVGRDAA